jgi:hypothetical protein
VTGGEVAVALIDVYERIAALRAELVEAGMTVDIRLKAFIILPSGGSVTLDGPAG